MLLGHIPTQDATVHGLAHVSTYLSVSHPVAKYASDSKKNQKTDTMLVQYLLLKMGTRDSPNDSYVRIFSDYVKRKGKFFAVDGKAGDMTFDMIINYQATSDSFVVSGTNGSLVSTMATNAGDGAVHPAPNDSQGSPITRDGNLYTIVHMNERFNTIFPEAGFTILTDPLAPQDLKLAVAKILPPRPTPLPNAAPAGILSMPSYHIARARHFPPGR
ncbi:MAG TPA: hypothetical protein VGM87_20085 [Roseomonas sp.]|jgi:hypothetical protein